MLPLVLRGGPADGTRMDVYETRLDRLSFVTSLDFPAAAYRYTPEVEQTTGRMVCVFDPTLTAALPHNTAIRVE